MINVPIHLTMVNTCFKERKRKYLLFYWIIFLLIMAFPKVYTQDHTIEEKPPLTPAWALEPWIWEDNGNTRGTITEVMTGYRHHNIPFGVVLIDSPWQTAYNSFVWDTLRYPDPQGFIDALHANDIRVVVWLTAFFNRTARHVLQPKHPQYDWIKSQGYTVNNGQDDEWWMGKGIHLDFTNKDAVNWWHTQLDKIIDMGIDGFKTDGGANNIGDTIVTSKGKMTREDYRKLYYTDVYDYLRKKNPEGIILARPYSHQGGYAAPVSKCPVGWCGDFLGNWDGLQLQMDNIYKSAQSGYGMVGCEIGGFVYRARSNKEQLIRYTQLGALLPVMINGGFNGGLSNHLPWFHDDETVRIYRYYATLHSELVPYIFSFGVHSHETGKPVIKSSDIENAQHLLGTEIFVSPIVNDELFKKVVFPDSHYWIDYWNEDRVFSPGSELYYSSSIERIPLFLKAGAIIPMNVKNGVTEHGDESSKDKLTVIIYPYKESSVKYNIPSGEGLAYNPIIIDVNEKTGEIRLISEVKSDVIIRVKSFTKPTSITGADSWRYDSVKRLIHIHTSKRDVKLKINGLAGYSSIIHIDS